MAEVFDCADPERRSAGITSAVGALKGGRLVVMPTDTVYGIGADAFDNTAVSALLSAKGRGRDMPWACWSGPGTPSKAWSTPCLTEHEN